MTAPEPREDVLIGGADVSVSFPDERDTAVAEVLAAHRGWGRHAPTFRGWDDVRWRCGCGGDIDDNPSGVNIATRHRLHVAEALAPLIAERERAAVERARDESAVAEVGLTDAEWTRLRHAAGNRGDLGPIAEEVERILGERERAAAVEGMDYPASQDPAHWAIWLRYRADRRHAQDNPGPAQASDSRRETER